MTTTGLIGVPSPQPTTCHTATYHCSVDDSTSGVVVGGSFVKPLVVVKIESFVRLGRSWALRLPGGLLQARGRRPDLSRWLGPWRSHGRGAGGRSRASSDHRRCGSFSRTEPWPSLRPTRRVRRSRRRCHGAGLVSSFAIVSVVWSTSTPGRITEFSHPRGLLELVPHAQCRIVASGQRRSALSPT